MEARFIIEQLHKSPKSVLLLGPRQVGKTTLMHALKADLTINLADEAEYRIFLTNFHELRDRIELHKAKTVFIDEIQRLPELLNTIQALIDEKKSKLKFYLTGSSARKLKRGSANLLPGRIFNYRLGPLSLLDLNFKIDSYKALELGCMPEPYWMENKQYAQKLLSTYAATYLKEEILAETLIRDLHGFSNFLNIVAENSGLFLDLSKLATKARVSRGAARNYYEILEDTLICDRLESYRTDDENLAAKLVKHSKYYLFDLGIRNGIIQNFTASNDRIGVLFEHLFFNQIKSCSYSLDKEIKFFHFRTLIGSEIDFVFSIGNKNIVVELKATEPTTDEIKKIEKICQNYNLGDNIYIACLKCKPKKVNTVKVLAWTEVIKEILDQI